MAKQPNRQPVHITRAGGILDGRDAIWLAIRAKQQFSVADIEDHIMNQPHNVRANQETIKTYIKCLVAGGYLKAIEGQRRQKDSAGRYVRMRWELVNDCGVDAPRLKKNGTPVTQGQARINMWRGMKILKTFSYRDLVLSVSTAQCPVKERDAKDYLQHLYKAGYLALLTPSKPRAGQIAVYRLIPSMNTGPKPPMVQRIKQVFDPNLGRVVWPTEEGES